MRERRLSTRVLPLQAELVAGVLVAVCPSELGSCDSGAQRIYEYTISWDATDSVPSIGELQVSSDNAGFDS